MCCLKVPHFISIPPSVWSEAICFAVCLLVCRTSDAKLYFLHGPTTDIIYIDTSTSETNHGCVSTVPSLLLQETEEES